MGYLVRDEESCGPRAILLIILVLCVRNLMKGVWVWRFWCSNLASNVDKFISGKFGASVPTRRDSRPILVTCTLAWHRNTPSFVLLPIVLMDPRRSQLLAVSSSLCKVLVDRMVRITCNIIHSFLILKTARNLSDYNPHYFLWMRAERSSSTTWTPVLHKCVVSGTAEGSNCNLISYLLFSASETVVS